MVRRYLGYDVQGWDELPWWQQVMYSQQLELDNRMQNTDPENDPEPDEYDPFESMAKTVDSPIFGMSVAPDGSRVDRVAYVAAEGTADAMEQMGVKVVRTTFGGA